MPIQPSYPGVYIQEIPSGVRTITGVSTSIGAFFGRTLKGPINKAVRCLSLSDFQREFGGGHALSDTGASIKQFFDNGGTDCYVVRIAKGAAPASVTLRNGRSGTDGTSRNVLTATAKSEGTWGQQIKLLVDYNTTNPDDSFNLVISNEAGGAVLAQETHSNLSMNPASPRFAPALVTQSSKLIKLAVHADLGDPATNGAFFNQARAANTPDGYSQSRRVFTGSSATVLRDGIRDTIDALIAAGKTAFNISVNGRSAPVDLTELDLSASTNITELADALTAHINAEIASEVPGLEIVCTWDTLATRTHVLRISSNSAPFTSVSITRGGANDISVPLMLGTEQGGVEVGRYSNLRPVPNGSYFWGTVAHGGFTTELDKFAVLAQNAISGIL